MNVPILNYFFLYKNPVKTKVNINDMEGSLPMESLSSIPTQTIMRFYEFVIILSVL